MASAEIFNPATGAVTLTGSMLSARRGHGATLLPNGKVLIAGGLDDASTTVLTSAEIYDPATGKFSAAGNMNSARFDHSARLLPSGKGDAATDYSGCGRSGSATWTATPTPTPSKGATHSATHTPDTDSDRHADADSERIRQRGPTRTPTPKPTAFVPARLFLENRLEHSAVPTQPLLFLRIQ
jgi:Galactose oxidase, central domain